MSEATKICPMCGESILAVALKCRYCGEYFDKSLRPRDESSALERMVLPSGRPGSAIAAGYCGLLAFFPFFGLIFGILGVTCGLKALRAIKADPSLSGKGRAWFGIIAGAPLAVLNGLGVIVLILGLIYEAHR